jgi:chaperonin GroEL (HSP60 family)
MRYDAVELVSHRMDWTSTRMHEKSCVREVWHSKLQVVLSASEALDMILRIDDIIKATPTISCLNTEIYSSWPVYTRILEIQSE